MSLCKDLVFLILQFCDEENLKKTAHMLEQETGYFFDLQYFEELLLHGNWEEAERYLSSFTVVEDNKYSTKIYFEIRKQKYLEALDKHDFAMALNILRKELKVFGQSNKDLYKEMTQLLALDDFREHNSLTFYGDTASARKQIINELRMVIEANPLLQERTKFPQINKSRLRRLVNQSLNWQHIHCAHPHPTPHIDTLFTDHKCPGPDNLMDQLNKETLLSSAPMESSTSPLTGISTSNQSSVTESKITTTGSPSGDSKDGDDASESNSNKPLDEVASASRRHASANELSSEFPRTVEQTFVIGSFLTSMDFNPVHETLLLVGKSVGDIELWDVASKQMLFKREFVTPGALLEDMGGNPDIISVKRVLWHSNGALFGVAYSKRMIHLYMFHRNANYLEKLSEIEAHVGSVNDIAFSKPNDKFVVISCGDDKLIQVWDAVTGAKEYTFEGHEAPVYSLCPQMKKDVHFLFSVSTRGEIKAWLFDNNGARLTYDAPGFCCMRMVYSTDGKRLFSCGTNTNGESYMVEWNEREGFIIRNYNGLSQSSSAMVQFDTSVNRFLAAGDEHLIKIWDMNNAEILAVIDADGDLPERPHICFNKKGNLLAVSAADNKIKILANDDGRELLQNSTFVSGELSTQSFRQGEALHVLQNVIPQGPAVTLSRMVMPNISEVVEMSRCQSVRLTSEVETDLIRRLVYTRAGNAILALADDGTHRLWKWKINDDNLSGMATTKCAPQLYQPSSGLSMVNDIPENRNNLIVTPCFALSKNDSYLISASGGKINLFNIMNFKDITSVMKPPPAATCLLFYPPDNNVLAIGFDDSTIVIYNIREDKLISRLKGHSARVTGLAYSTNLNVLVSSGSDTEIVVWDGLKWEKKRSTVLHISNDWMESEFSETTVELDKDQNHFIATHETQLAIHETMTLRRVKQWTIANFCTRISHAVYSCDSELVYAVMRDGILLILGASDLSPRFEIDPSAYLPSQISSYVDPFVIAAHPEKPYQIALGLTNGEVVVIEPLGNDEGQWAAPPLARI